MNEQSFYKRLRHVMQAAQMNAATLSEKSKIKYSTLTGYCRGAFEPRISELMALAQALQVPAALLLPTKLRKKTPKTKK